MTWNKALSGLFLRQNSLISLVNTPHQFISQGTQKVVVVESNQLDAEVFFSNSQLKWRVNSLESGIQWAEKIRVSILDLKRDHIIIGDDDGSYI